jgi:N-hydroxyarylamine O-acetyltransferase
VFEEYLARIGLARAPAVSEAGLRDLHAAQAYTLAFENLTPILDEPVAIEIPALFDKMVRGTRGGYCFELNGLFRWAAAEGGFRPNSFLARVKATNPEPGPLTHQIALVPAGGRSWLCDVGFGGPGIRTPMPFELGRIDHQQGDDFRISLNPELGYTLEARSEGGEWSSLYFFHLHEALSPDIVMGNFFTSRWERSAFRLGFRLSRPFPGGKRTMYGRAFKRRSAQGVHAERVETPARLGEILKIEFGIELDPTRFEKLAGVFASMG